MVTRKRLSAQFRPGADPQRAITALLAETAAFADAAGLAMRDGERLAIIVEELASNAARHAAQASAMSLAVALQADDASVAIRVEDDGAAFDPTRRGRYAGPDPETGGGVGLELVSAWCEGIAYAREGGANRLELNLPRDRG